MALHTCSRKIVVVELLVDVVVDIVVDDVEVLWIVVVAVDVDVEEVVDVDGTVDVEDVDVLVVDPEEAKEIDATCATS